MQHKFISSLLIVCFFIAPAYAQSNTGNSIHIIPEPVSMTVQSGAFNLTRDTRFVIANRDKDSLQEAATLFAGAISRAAGFTIPVTSGENRKNAILLQLNRQRDAGIEDEGYHLSVTASGISITANRPAGVFYGLQTLLQLLPPDIESTQRVQQSSWRVPAVKITDYPRFGWRGLMLDVSRHFFTKEEVERYIDEMVKYKYNVFHWHLSDDNGWRIEIKSLPKLTQIGAWRVPRTGRFGDFQPPQPGEAATDGGFYTQDDIREIVKYAQDRFVTILPEIDVPAHSLALIAAYPGLSCTKLQYQVNPGTPFYMKIDNALCVGNDSTYIVLDKIFTEIAQLFPGPYIHVGGDEAYKGFWEKDPLDQQVMKDNNLKSLEELQSYFEKKLEKIIISKGKKMIGWDEILEGGLAPEAAVMSWRGIKGGIQAAKMGHHVVMTPWANCYLDLYQGDPAAEPATYGMLRLHSCYDYEPVPEGVDAGYILGGQGNLWSESVPNFRHAEYMTWPRAMALSEVWWSPKVSRNWDDFIGRMEAQFPRLDAQEVKYARSAYQATISPVKDSTVNEGMKIRLNTEINGLDIYYTFDGTNPDRFYPKYTGEPLLIPKGASEIRVITYRGDTSTGQQVNVKLESFKKK